MGGLVGPKYVLYNLNPFCTDVKNHIVWNPYPKIFIFYIFLCKFILGNIT